MWLYQYFHEVVFIHVNKCDDVFLFCVFLVHLHAQGWRDWFRSSPHYFATLTSLQKGITPSYRPCFIYETSPVSLAFVYFLRLNILVIRFILYSFGNFSRPINARFTSHYQCMIFITLCLTNFAEFTHIEETSCLCTTRFERLQIPYIG